VVTRPDCGVELPLTFPDSIKPSLDHVIEVFMTKPFQHLIDPAITLRSFSLNLLHLFIDTPDLDF
jgi:hypothetical protein